MNEPRRLTELVLDRSLLNVFVIGPGYGEAILVALPSAGWLVIDGASRSGDFPVHELLEAQLNEERIEALLLTHPHRDHYRGMRELIDHQTLGPRIRRIGCVKALVEDESSDSTSPEVLRDAGSARAILERIKSWWAVHPDGRLELARGALPLDLPGVEASILHPTREQISAFLDPQGRRSRIRGRANELSVVLELRFGDGRYLFTGDLPRQQWEQVCRRARELNIHNLLKLPHHGSEGAHPPALLAPHCEPRQWVLTPFNRGSKPSRPPTLSGLAALLEHEPELHLTAFPTAWQQTRPAPASVRLDALEAAPVSLRGRRPSGRLTRRGATPNLRLGDCCWLFCFDRGGALTRSVRGRVATKIVP